MTTYMPVELAFLYADGTWIRETHDIDERTLARPDVWLSVYRPEVVTRPGLVAVLEWVTLCVPPSKQQSEGP